MRVDDLEAAWNDLHDVMPSGWVAGRPRLRDDSHVWEQAAYRPKERHDAGRRKDEWLATGPTEAECVAEVARCLREIREGRWPPRPSYPTFLPHSRRYGGVMAGRYGRLVRTNRVLVRASGQTLNH